jgi:radical SAM-linked protein
VSAVSKINVRLAFQKRGRAVFLSHLDLMKVFQRAFYRLGLPLRYTEGFNQHAYLSAALPLGLGTESLCERLDFGVAAEPELEGLPESLNATLPEGITVTDAGIAGRPFSEIRFLGVDFWAETGCGAERLRELFSGAVLVDKRTKKGISETDILPMIREISFEDDGRGVRGSAVLSAQNPTLSPDYIELAARKYADPEASFRFLRTSLLDFGGGLFDLMRQE